ncbi:hypothetical protein J6590_067170 [Homalodisca vitripennis]|nr:hypothetical protein J6590_067170 [Homalodisca vitripennis]
MLRTTTSSSVRPSPSGSPCRVQPCGGRFILTLPAASNEKRKRKVGGQRSTVEGGTPERELKSGRDVGPRCLVTEGGNSDFIT